MRKTLVFLLATVSISAAAGEAEHRILFESQSPEFEAAADEYRAIWAEDGAAVVAAMERYTGLPFEKGPITTIVYEGISFSGYKDEQPMMMRASYAPDTKKATLVHELSHRLLADVVPLDFEDHPVIFLFLFDVWVELWGEDLAIEQVAVESRRRGVFDYESAWEAALAMTPEERAEAWQAFIESLDN